MSEKFKLTQEEIQEVVLRSPYSLADSPASVGQRAAQIKKYFYDFIRTLAQKINLHMSEIGTLLSEYELLIGELQKKDSELGDSIKNQIDVHSSSLTAHQDIRNKIESEHAEIKQRLSELQGKNELALAIASGRSRISTFDDAIEMIDYITLGNECLLGDIYLIADSSCPDFTVFEVGTSAREDDILLDSEKIASGELTLYPDLSYFAGGVRLISSEGNLETSRLAKREELDSLEQELIRSNARLDEAEAALSGKEDTLITTESTESSILIEGGREYNLGTRTELTIDVDDASRLDALINFSVGEAPLTFDAPLDVYFLGDDTLFGAFYPVTNRLYEVSIKRACGALVARVGAVDYEVIE